MRGGPLGSRPWSGESITRAIIVPHYGYVDPTSDHSALTPLILKRLTNFLELCRGEAPRRPPYSITYDNRSAEHRIAAPVEGRKALQKW
jgi:hypothetical protein